jgi:hypothetical protein
MKVDSRISGGVRESNYRANAVAIGGAEQQDLHSVKEK